LLKKIESRHLLIYCLFCLSFFTPHLISAEASGKSEAGEILAIGSSPIINDNLALAKKKALSQALRKGIEDHLVRKLGRNNVVNNFHRIVNEIIPSSGEEIENFHILAEDHIGGQYNILVKLRINKKVMDKTLRRAGMAIMQGPAIKVLFLISEKDEEKTSYWWKDPEFPPPMNSIELSLYKAFQERGYRPINRRLGLPQVDFSEELRAPDLTNEAILTWGELFSADVVIRGKTEVLENEQLSLSLKALDVDKGVLICQDTHIQPIQKDLKGNRQTTEAIEILVNNLVSKLTPAIIKAAGSGSEETQTLEVILTGLKTYRQFMDFRDFLVKNVTGVKSVKQTRVKKDSIYMEVQFKDDENKFMERVLNHANLPFLLDHSLTEEGIILIEVK
jgi:hypothetical protein